MRIDENGRTVIRAKSPGSIRRLPNGSRKGSSVTQQMGGVKEGHIFHEPKRGKCKILNVWGNVEVF